MCRLAGLLLLTALSGCQLGYYGQAVHGHWSLMAKRQPLEQVLADPHTSAQLASQLRLSRQVMAFANQQLDLPASHVYQQYVSLDRQAVVWNVLAAPRFSLMPKTWCYLLLGCVSYRGYFHQGAAEKEAARLAKRGLDSYVAGAIAYSTLGWFDDPLTTPMVARPAPALVELLIHELVHRRLYIRDDTRFNESLATLVAREGAIRFLSHSKMPLDPTYWQQRDRAQQAFVALVGDARQQLAALYRSDLSALVMAKRKAAIQQQLRDQFAAQRQRVPGLAAYQRFFAGPLNNAQLNGVSDYNGWVPAFAALLLHCGGQWDCFWPQVEQLATLPVPQRLARLQALAGGQ